MKEYIFQPTIAQDGNAIVIADAPTGLIKKNILAIINKSTKGIIHSPLLDGIASLAYSGTTLTINLNAGHLSIEGDLLIKAYTDDAAGGYDEMLAQFFGVADSYEAQAKGGERTNNTVIDECKVRFQDAFNGLLPTGFTMPNSVTVDNLTYTGTTNS